jgi:glycine/D-amino acid oxidase-like deaminating enzyme
MPDDPGNPAPLPERADVVIIGGGIIGCSAAYFLAKEGASVVLCEKGRIAGEQSSRNWGFVRQQGRDPAELPLIIESLRIWRGLAEEIDDDVGFQQTGILYLSDDEESLAGYEAWLEHAKRHQLDSRLVSSDEVARMLPGATGNWVGGLYTASDGKAEPDLAAPAIARAAARHGAAVLTGCAVRGIETEGGRVSAAVTERGTVRCPAVVCAAGAWSSLFSGNLGITLPQLKVTASVLRTSPAPAITEGGVWTKGVALRRRRDGGYSVAHGNAVDCDIVPDSFRFFRAFMPGYEAERGKLKLRFGRRFFEELTTPRRWANDQPTPFEKTRVLDPAPNQRFLAEATANLRRLFPELKDVGVAESWAGLIDVTPDAIPVISPLERPEGYFLATGFSGHGFGIGPGAGKLVAEIVTGGPTTVDPTPFRFGRFTDGGALGPTTGL